MLKKSRHEFRYFDLSLGIKRIIIHSDVYDNDQRKLEVIDISTGEVLFVPTIEIPWSDFLDKHFDMCVIDEDKYRNFVNFLKTRGIGSFVCSIYIEGSLYKVYRLDITKLTYLT